MTKSWLEKTMHTGEEVDAAQLIKSLHASRDALKIERDNALAENERLRAELKAARRDAELYKARFEYLRKLTPMSFSLLWKSCLGDMPFDSAVDAAIARGDKQP